ncbi:hypothetical protein Tco_1556065 [Tanacetum coccineum]
MAPFVGQSTQLRPKIMSPAMEETPNADGFVHNTANREETIPQDFLTSSVTLSAMREFCEKHYTQILPFMAEKAHNEKLRDVCSRLTYREDIEQETESASCYQKIKMRCGKQKEIQKPQSRRVFSRLGTKESKGGGKDLRHRHLYDLQVLSINGKTKESTGGVNEKTPGTSRQKVKTALGEGTGRGNPGKLRKERVKTYLSLMMRNPPPLLPEE